jgi:DNA (cytosine-5)-methyltransferase 1
MTSIELFSGCGGLAKGLEIAGFQHCAFIEFNKWACESLRANFDPALVHETDIRAFDFSALPSVDLVAGGPPCQPFSLGGLAKAHNDHRDMFPQAIRAIRELRPRAFVFENVKGLLRKSFSDYFNYIVARLTFPDCVAHPEETWQSHESRLDNLVYSSWPGLKYRISFKLLNAADFGVPQIRERVFIVGIRSDVAGKWEWPNPLVTVSERRTISDALKTLPPPTGSHNLCDHIFIDGAKTYPGHTGSDINKPSKTIKAGAHGVPGGENIIRFEDGSVRYMTVHEAKLIQTFPPGYRICGTWGEAMRQIGNAVPVKLATLIGQQLHSLPSASKDQSTAFLYRTGTDGTYVLFEDTRSYSVATFNSSQRNTRMQKSTRKTGENKRDSTRVSRQKVSRNATIPEGT